MTDEDFALFVIQSSCVPQSGERAARLFHRWRRRLLFLGVTTVRRLSDGPGTADEESARLQLTLLMLQAARPRTQSIEHPLRDRTGIR
jgi:hypothetical protein